MKTKCANASGFPNEAISIKSHMTTLLGENRDKKIPGKSLSTKTKFVPLSVCFSIE